MLPCVATKSPSPGMFNIDAETLVKHNFTVAIPQPHSTIEVAIFRAEDIQ
jgi:hypothetical protein